ncbi:MAG TPA: GAF domain-containing sensor histidine kinase [Dissulfurispiraceae bacterium]|nr:GAF domain-containing sensor histidine kinase [Dissulfurispiraceae bacterium]
MDLVDKSVSSSSLLKLLIRRLSRKKYLGHVVDLFTEWSGCSCVGVRVLNEDGTIPYEAYKGFSDEFWKGENWLSVKDSQCACIRVMTGQAEPCDSAFMTPRGTFLTNNLASFNRNLNENEKKLFRGACVNQGLMSMAVIPVHYGNKVVAAVHIADKKKNMLPEEKVAALESVTPLIGQAIQRFGIEDRLKKNYAMQRAVNSLMRMSLNNSDTGDILGKALDKVLSMTWLPFEQKGCVFLVKDRPGVLELVAHRSLPESLLKNCNEVPFGKCICGRAASEKVAVFVSKHDPEYVCVNHSQGHYCLPLTSSGRMLGVANFFLKEDQQLNSQHREFLSTIGNALSGIIIRKEAEDNLRDSREQLRRLAVHLQTSREEERTEFAREVHDELGQALTALKMDMFWIRKRLPEHEGPLVAKIDAGLDLVDSTLRSVRRICTELRPDILDHLGIVAAVEWQIEEFRKRTGISCSVKISPRDIELDRNLSIFLFRIIQEAFTNIIRHSGATEVSFAMEGSKESVSVRIADNGKGILKKHISGAKSFGILGIKERVHFWNGNFSIEGAPGKGTTLTITVPLVKSMASRDAGSA